MIPQELPTLSTRVKETKQATCDLRPGCGFFLESEPLNWWSSPFGFPSIPKKGEQLQKGQGRTTTSPAAGARARAPASERQQALEAGQREPGPLPSIGAEEDARRVRVGFLYTLNPWWHPLCFLAFLVFSGSFHLTH